MFEQLITTFVKRYVGLYLKNFDADQLNIGLTRGEVELHDLELNGKAIEHLDIPIQLQKGVLGHFKLRIPWTQLGTAPISIEISDIYISLLVRDVYENEEDKARKTLEKYKKERQLYLYDLEICDREIKSWEEKYNHVVQRRLQGISPKEEKPGIIERTTSRVVEKIVNNITCLVSNIQFHIEGAYENTGINIDFNLEKIVIS